jgi:Sec-independent protein translocase protein TatA
MQIGWLQILVIGLVVLVLFGKLPNIIQDLKSAYLELSKKNEEKDKFYDHHTRIDSGLPSLPRRAGLSVDPAKL